MFKFSNHITKPTSIAPLITFRMLFGFIMLVSIIRFAWNGWIYEQYIQPEFFFSYYGFEWVKPLPPYVIYLVFLLMGISAFMIMLGAYYRVFTVLFFLSFIYVELIDKTNYLNHYYFVSLISFLLIFVPANRGFSLDIIRKPNLKLDKVPAWTINIFKLQLGIVYFYAGIAKINSDWLLKALPLKIWLPAHSNIPILGTLLKASWVAYVFSWFGAIYDLTIPFLLTLKKLRPFAYAAVIVFHMLTWLLFPIGMFPFIMILSTLIFFSTEFHERLIRTVAKWIKSPGVLNRVVLINNTLPYKTKKIAYLLLSCYIIIQVLLPWRYLLYPGDLFWTEEGYRFSWRVMLMEKAGYVIFNIEDHETGRKGEAYAADYLTPNQEKMMATQPDMILQFAHFLHKEYQLKGIADPIVTANAYVTLNGNGNRLFLDNQVNLAEIEDSFTPKSWILPLKTTHHLSSK